jgi:hypothetical protein
VQLHVLAIGHVGDVAAEALTRPRDRPELVGGHRPAVDADAHHEELVLELLGLGAAGAVARHALRALRVQPPPRMRLRRSCLPIERKPPGAKMRSMRSRTLRPSSSFLICSAGFSGS